MDTFEAVKAWFGEAGWVANAIALFGPMGLLVAFFWRRLSPLFGESNLEVSVQQKILPIWTVNSLRDIAEIAIVDDQPSDFPVAELRKVGYHIKTYKQVNLSDYRSLAKYDLVFLDMHGIVKDDVNEGGLKLIESLRKANPRQKICAVSSKQFDPTATAFFRQADDVQKKPISAQKCAEVVDILLGEKLGPKTLASNLNGQFNKFSRGQKVKLVRLLVTPLGKNEDEIYRDAERITGKQSEEFSSTLVDFIRVARRATN